jgi:hypothetical protein
MIRSAVGTIALCSALGVTLAACQQTPPPQACTSIEYAGPAEAMEALLADPTTKRSIERGWYLIERRRGKLTEYRTFTPSDHPAHPSVGMRVGCQGDDGAGSVSL